MKLKCSGVICGVASVMVLCAGYVRAEGTNDTGTGKGAFREEMKSYFEQQKEENKAFRSEEKGVTNLDEKISAIIEHRNQQYKENTAFFAKLHGEVMAKIKEKMSKNNRLNAAQQTDVINFFDKQYQENVTFRDTEHKSLISGLQALESKQGLSKDEVKDQIKSLFEKSKEDRESHRKTQEAENKAFREKMREEVKAGKESASGSGGGSTATK
jgi:hypothetical protein